MLPIRILSIIADNVVLSFPEEECGLCSVQVEEVSHT